MMQDILKGPYKDSYLPVKGGKGGCIYLKSSNSSIGGSAVSVNTFNITGLFQLTFYEPCNVKCES